MALKIRLWQQGKKHRRSFRFVVSDVLSPSRGKVIDQLGWYDPQGDEEKGLFLSLEGERVEKWLSLGAQPTEKVLALLKRGVPQIVASWKEKSLQKRERVRKQRREKRVAGQK